jgi:hypothetical protein
MSNKNMDKHNLLELTHYYSDAFNARKLETIESLLSQSVKQAEAGLELKGKKAVLNHIQGLYDSNSVLNFYATRILASEEDSFSLIEFDLEIGNAEKTVLLRGTDHITWNKHGEIEFLEAFVY